MSLPTPNHSGSTCALPLVTHATPLPWGTSGFCLCKWPNLHSHPDFACFVTSLPCWSSKLIIAHCLKFYLLCHWTRTWHLLLIFPLAPQPVSDPIPVRPSQHQFCLAVSGLCLPWTPTLSSFSSAPIGHWHSTHFV